LQGEKELTAGFINKALGLISRYLWVEIWLDLRGWFLRLVKTHTEDLPRYLKLLAQCLKLLVIIGRVELEYFEQHHGMEEFNPSDRQRMLGASGGLVLHLTQLDHASLACPELCNVLHNLTELLGYALLADVALVEILVETVCAVVLLLDQVFND